MGGGMEGGVEGGVEEVMDGGREGPPVSLCSLEDDSLEWAKSVRVTGARHTSWARKMLLMSHAQEERGEGLEQEQRDIFHGHLRKRGQINTVFKRRFFVLEHAFLKFYTNNPEGQDKAELKGQLACAGLTTHPDYEWDCRFDIISKNGRVLQCESETPAEREAWMEHVAAAALSADVAMSLNLEDKHDSITVTASFALGGVLRLTGPPNEEADCFFKLLAGINMTDHEELHNVYAPPILFYIYVPEVPVLLEGSIMKNLLLGANLPRHQRHVSPEQAW